MIDPDIIITTRAALAARDRELVAAAERMALAAQPAAAPRASVMGIEAGKYRYLTQREIEDGAASGIVPLFAVPVAVPPVEQIVTIIERHEEWADWRQAAREIVALTPAPAVPEPAMRAHWNNIEAALEAAQSCLCGETPEVLSPSVAREWTLNAIREALLTALPAVRSQPATAPDPRATAPAEMPAVMAELIREAQRLIQEGARGGEVPVLVRRLAALSSDPIPPDPRAAELAKRLCETTDMLEATATQLRSWGVEPVVAVDRCIGENRSVGRAAGEPAP